MAPVPRTLLVEAAQLATDVFHDEARAISLVERAHAADPGNVAALLALADAHRRRGESGPLAPILRALVAGTPQGDASAKLKLELARLLVESGETDEARGLLEPLAAGGRSGPGYAEALELLVPLLGGEDDALARSTVLAARAELAQGSERAQLLYGAARAAQQAGDEARAARLARASVATEASQDALLLLAGLMRDASELAKAAASLTQAAQLASPEDRPGFLLEAAEAWEGAGDPAEAQELLDRVARLHPETLGPGAWAARFLRLGARAQAIEHGYEPLFAHGAFAQALEVAEALEDPPRIRQSLWGLAQGPAGAEPLLGWLDLAPRGGHRRRARGLRRARRVAPGDGHRGGAPSRGAPLTAGRRLGRGAAACAPASAGARRAGGERCSTRWSAWTRTPRRRWWRRCCSSSVVAAGVERERGLRLLAARVPSRAAELWQTLFEQARDDNRLEDAASALAAWVEATPDPVQRSGLRVQAGDLALAIGWTEAARAAWAQAAAEDPTSVQAASKLLALTTGEASPAEFADLAERLSSLAGPEALAGRQDELVQAYVQLGRAADAFGVLSQLPGTEERVRLRAELAESLGRANEALALREQLAHTPEEREALALAALRADRIADVVRILGPLGSADALSPDSRREFAAALARTEAGAPFAVQLWALLLSENALDAEGWALHGEALRNSGRHEAAARSVAFGELFAGEEPAPALVAIQPVVRAPVRTSVTLPGGVLPVTPEDMPDLRAVLDDALAALGAPGVQIWLDPAGASEAWLAGANDLVLGAGALSLFGPIEHDLPRRAGAGARRWGTGAGPAGRGAGARCGGGRGLRRRSVARPPRRGSCSGWTRWRAARTWTRSTPAAVLTGSAALAAVVQRALRLV